jgi:Skp family chaperone for outer membrane proteins
MAKPKLIAGCLASLIAAYIVGQWIRAQAQPAPAPAATRIGVVNLAALLQNWKKGQIYKRELDKELQPLRAQAEALKKKIMEREAELKVGNPDTSKRKQMEEASGKDMKKLEELEREADRRNRTKVENELGPLYKEMLEAIKTHARSNSIQVVLSYLEDPKIDPFSFASIRRKLFGLETTGCVAALYADPASDITAALTEFLNRRFDALSR